MQNNLPLKAQQPLKALSRILVKCYIDQSITEDQARQQIEELNTQVREE